MKEFWDERYSAEEYIYGTEANDFLKNELLNIQAGNILLPCEGEGRNAVFCAKNDWKVSAFDYSDVAVKKGIKLAKSMNLEIDYIHSDWQSYKNDNKFDVVGIVFAHFHPEDRIEFHKKMMNFLKPGGILIAEYFHKNQINYNSGGPKNIDMLYTIEELRSDFSEYEIIKLEHLSRKIFEGPHHSGVAETVQVVIKK